MSIFTTNQARQLYVVNAYQASTLANVGDIKVVKQGDCIYFEHLGAAGVTRSDLIPIDSITYAKATKASAMAPKRKTIEVTLNSNVNSGAPVAGEHYILRVNYRQFVGMSDEDTYSEIAEVLGTTGLSASDFYKKLGIALAKNDANQGLIEVKVYANNTDVVVTAATEVADIAGTATKIKITAAVPEWILGKKAYAPANFELTASSIVAGGLAVEPFTFAAGTAATDGNGKVIADLEWFCMGERADIYRGAGWPNNIETKYLVDPAHQYGVIDIHYAYQGTCEDIQKSEKDIELVVDCGTAGTTYTEINKVISAINTATGIPVSVSGVTAGAATATGTAGSALLTALS